jgi:two-component system chemotaxis response regulator CheB
MRRVRVLVVDDSVMMRRLVSEMIAADPELEVAGIAHHGSIALAKIPQVAPDVITLDVDMPVMDGLETLSRLRSEYPDLPVIIFTGLTEYGARSTIEALAMGASDYVTKPSGIGTGGTVEQVRDDLLGKIKALGFRAIRHQRRPSRGPVQKAPGPMEVVVIATSTGGPNALVQLLPELGSDLPVPVLIIQHMPPLFTRFLAERLDHLSGLTVREAVEGARLEPGTVWIAPGDYHMEVERDAEGAYLHLHQGPLENSCRPSADPTLRSTVNAFGSHVLAVVMTGMGRDGLAGAKAVREAGGKVLAQDRESSVIWGMPRFVVEAGLPDEVVPLSSLGAAIRAHLGASRSTPAEACP